MAQGARYLIPNDDNSCQEMYLKKESTKNSLKNFMLSLPKSSGASVRLRGLKKTWNNSFKIDTNKAKPTGWTPKLKINFPFISHLNNMHKEINKIEHKISFFWYLILLILNIFIIKSKQWKTGEKLINNCKQKHNKTIIKIIFTDWNYFH